MKGIAMQKTTVKSPRGKVVEVWKKPRRNGKHVSAYGAGKLAAKKPVLNLGGAT